MSVSRKDLSRIAADRLKLNVVSTDTICKEFISSLINILKQGKRVELRGLGAFIPKEYKPRPGRNPRNGDIFQVPAMTKIRFKCSRNLKENIS